MALDSSSIISFVCTLFAIYQSNLKLTNILLRIRRTIEKLERENREHY